MDDLINRNVVLDFIQEEIKQDRPDDFKIKNIQRYIEDIPTAYNVERVAEQIDEVLQDLNVLEVMSHFDLDSAIQNDLDNFLQAVKNEILRKLKEGGVNE